ncbi:hypothetical protein HYPGJ_30436 [Hyphomicrobium sp. GJ21]|nr:hypothetical protein HYPGJ_30436 [Hyphomicrobium sp. GJ21]
MNSQGFVLRGPNLGTAGIGRC